MSDDIPIVVAVEDVLSETVVRTLLEKTGRPYDVLLVLGKRGKGYLQSKVVVFKNWARGMPCLVLADLDDIECAPRLVDDWLPRGRKPNLVFRVAVREVEAWVLADRSGFARFLGIPRERIPEDVETIARPKEFLISLARKSRRTRLAQDIIPRFDTSRQGPDYNGRLGQFVRSHWDIHQAMHHSDSLRRAFNALKDFEPVP